MGRRDWLNIPNIISLMRIAAVPALVYLLWQIAQHPEQALRTGAQLHLYAAAIFAAAAISDVIDGYWARRAGTVTIFGKLVDPLADKLLTFAGLIMLIPLQRMTAWLVVLLLAREIGVTTLRSIATSHGLVIAAGQWGKLKTGLSNFGIPFLMIYYPYFDIHWYEMGWILVIASTIFSIVSGVQYCLAFWRHSRTAPIDA